MTRALVRLIWLSSLFCTGHARSEDPQPDFEAALAKSRGPRPDFSIVTSPALSRALEDPERLWEFLTDPQTPYAERRAAVQQGREVFPLELVPRLMAARRELEVEQSMHHWGLKPHPLSAWGWWPSAVPEDSRSRPILGHTYILPQEPMDYPLSWEAEATAPWPWQVQQTLEALFQAVAPRGDNPRAARWLEVAMQIPATTDEEALLFAQASAAATHFKTLPVMARWRKIALDPATPHAAYFVANRLAEAVRLWDVPQSHVIGRVILTDILRHSPHRQVREQAAYAVPRLREGWQHGEIVRHAPSPSLTIAAAEWALNPASGGDWTRLYVYVFSVCDALDDPPIVPQRGMSSDRRYYPQSPENVEALDAFEQWYLTHKDELVRAAAREEQEFEPVRAELIAVADNM